MIWLWWSTPSIAQYDKHRNNQWTHWLLFTNVVPLHIHKHCCCCCHCYCCCVTFGHRSHTDMHELSWNPHWIRSRYGGSPKITFKHTFMQSLLATLTHMPLPHIYTPHSLTHTYRNRHTHINEIYSAATQRATERDKTRQISVCVVVFSSCECFFVAFSLAARLLLEIVMYERIYSGCMCLCYMLHT